MDNNPQIKTVLVIALCSTLGVSFASSLPEVNVAASAKQQQVKPDENTITYNYGDGAPLKLTGYSNSVSDYNEGVQKTLQYNAQNEIVVDDHGNKLDYDALGEMVSFDNSQTHEEVNYAYDVESHQVSESVIDAKGKTTSHSFYYSTGDKAQMLAESDNDDNQLSYLFAEEKIGSLNNNNEANLYITDQAGSVVALVSNSQLSREYVYSPYGIDTDVDTSTTKAKNAQGFDGQRTDHATGYQFLGNGYRAYNPILHRFMQMDDLRYSPFGKGGINGYVFGNNNPIMNFDPSGHSILGIIANIVVLGLTMLAAPYALGIIGGTSMLGVAVGTSLLSGAGGVLGQLAEDGTDKLSGENHPQMDWELISAAAGGFATGIVGAVLDIGGLYFHGLKHKTKTSSLSC